MLRRLWVILVVSALLLTGCGGVTPTPGGGDQGPVAPAKEVDRRVTDAGLSFGLKLLEQLRAASPGKNVIISPASISLILSLTANGAEGDTRADLIKALGFDGLALNEINQANAALHTVLANPDPKVKLEVANSIWHRQELKAKAAFAGVGRDAYRAEVKPLDFAKSGAPAEINKWVARATHDKIDGIVDQIPADAVMYLINALYFNGTWSKPFDKKATQPATFSMADGTSAQPQMMRVGGNFRYHKSDGFEAVALPYGDGRVSMYLFLPARESSLQAFSQGLTAERLTQAMSLMRSKEGTVGLPRMKVEYKASLKDSLKALGMQRPFAPGLADFSGLLEGFRPGDLFISEVQHKTYMDINEQGTEAAAVTSVEIQVTSAPVDPPFQFIVDRPFLLMIRDDATGTALFLGAVVDVK